MIFPRTACGIRWMMKLALPEIKWVEDWGEAQAKVDGTELEVASAVEAAVKGEAGETEPEK